MALRRISRGLSTAPDSVLGGLFLSGLCIVFGGVAAMARSTAEVDLAALLLGGGVFVLAVCLVAAFFRGGR